MPSKKRIKRRIASVTTTKKIVTAMHLVASSKLQKNRERLEAARPFFGEMERIMRTLAASEAAADSLFFAPRPVKSTAYLVITSDKGLCGSYNFSLAEAALAHMKGRADEKIIVLGQKGYDFFKQRGKHIHHRYSDTLEIAFHEDAERIGRMLTGLYARGEADEVYVAYTQFASVSTYLPRVERILPLDIRLADAEKPGAVRPHDVRPHDIRPHDMRYDPDAGFFLAQAAPLYVGAFIYNALLESFACEQAARMFNMDAAESNASDILEKLTRQYNRSRQTAITQEISEIVNGANSMNMHSNRGR